jgi:hypothetical protein
MGGIADTSFSYLLNRMFPKGLADAVYRDPKTTFLALVKKNPNAHGTGFETVVDYTSGGGRSRTFATAKTNAANGQDGERFYFQYSDDFAFARIGAKDMKAAQKNGGVVNVMDKAFKTAMRKIKRSLARGLAGDGSGSIGTIGSNAGSTITLSDWRSARHVEVGDVLVSAAAKTSGGLRTGSITVTAVNKARSSGVITFTANGGWTATNGDYLFIEGDRNGGFYGVAAWLPATAPTSGDSFGGVDRSVDPLALAGVRVDVSSEASLVDGLLSGMEEFRLYSVDSTHCILSAFDFTRLERELEGKKRIIEVPNEYELGLKGIELDDGTVCVMDPYFDKGYAYPINIDTWELKSMGEAPHIAEEDGLKMLRMDTADAFEAMIRYWANLECNDPSQNGVMTLPALG